MREKKKDTHEISKEEFLYHNTEILLKKYRDVVWSIEASAIQAEISFELEMDCRLEDFLEMSYEAGADLSGTHIQEQMRTLERNKKMLKIIEKSVEILRNSPMLGEVYYWIIYFTYLSPQVCLSVEDIVQKVNEKTNDFMSRKTYFKHRKEAINKLSNLLWGFTTKDTSNILKQFV